MEQENMPVEPVIEKESAPVSNLDKLLLPEDNEKFGKRVIDGKIVMVRYRHSFTSRMIQAPEPMQDYYTAIKNYLLSFKKVKDRMSWNFETYSQGRRACAKLNVKGKTLFVYLALDPPTYIEKESKYRFKDVGDKPKFRKTPMLMKVRSARGLKYAMELIDEMMRAMEIPQKEIPTEDYHYAYEATDDLVDRDLVKIIYPAGTEVREDSEIRRVTPADLEAYSLMLEQTAREQAAAEAQVEEAAPVEEAVVEKAAPVEEAVVEEAAPVEEAVVEEAAPVEEAVVEEAVVEEAASVEEAVVEETVVEETVVEEAAPIEEAPAEEVVVEKTAPVDPDKPVVRSFRLYRPRKNPDGSIVEGDYIPSFRLYRPAKVEDATPVDEVFPEEPVEEDYVPVEEQEKPVMRSFRLYRPRRNPDGSIVEEDRIPSFRLYREKDHKKAQGE